MNTTLHLLADFPSIGNTGLAIVSLFFLKWLAHSEYALVARLSTVFWLYPPGSWPNLLRILKKICQNWMSPKWRMRTESKLINSFVKLLNAYLMRNSWVKRWKQRINKSFWSRIYSKKFHLPTFRMVNDVSEIYKNNITTTFLWTLSVMCCSLLMLQKNYVQSSKNHGIKFWMLINWRIIFHIIL